MFCGLFSPKLFSGCLRSGLCVLPWAGSVAGKGYHKRGENPPASHELAAAGCAFPVESSFCISAYLVPLTFYFEGAGWREGFAKEGLLIRAAVVPSQQ